MDKVIYGRLTIIKFLDKKRVECLCSCGNKIVVLMWSLKSRNTKSCGCLRDENRIKHGMSYHPLYNKWKGIKNRCTNPNSRDYKYYGARGIDMDPRWMDVKVFINDLENHLGEVPNGASIDRIDNNKGYYINNVSYADNCQQNLNKRYSSNKLGKEYKHIYEKNDNGYIYYEIRIRRQKTLRMAATKELILAIKIRDEWLYEYNNNTDEWIIRTKNKEYKKDVAKWKKAK